MVKTGGVIDGVFLLVGRIAVVVTGPKVADNKNVECHIK